jgi:hypothetical protein
MLPPYIIEEIRKREEERKRRDRWNRVELPMEPPLPDWNPDRMPGRDGGDDDPPSEVDYRI